MRLLKRLAGIGTAGLLATALWGGTAHAMGPLARFSCDVDLTTASSWPTGWVGGITINNTGTEPFSGWVLQFELAAGQSVSSAWVGTLTQALPIVQVRAPVWASGIAAGSWAEIGYVLIHTGVSDPPRNFTLNGVACTI
ncbi:cellulose binding domain-containing protein [Sphaerisporangium aureirubrum]|uniref:Cellulose binding domain-containing protein n=1 Tax=Sphaerisporangium aureirubrum TaxID=1544736 RepID=A0ABW1NNX6_9ACTN